MNVECNSDECDGDNCPIKNASFLSSFCSVRTRTSGNCFRHSVLFRPPISDNDLSLSLSSVAAVDRALSANFCEILKGKASREKSRVLALGIIGRKLQLSSKRQDSYGATRMYVDASECISSGRCTYERARATHYCTEQINALEYTHTHTHTHVCACVYACFGCLCAYKYAGVLRTGAAK